MKINNANMDEKLEFVNNVNMNIQGCSIHFGVWKGEISVRVSGFSNELDGSIQDVKVAVLEEVEKHFVVHSNCFHRVSAMITSWVEDDSFAFEGFFEV